MPAKSKQQYRFFKALENNPELRKEKDITKEVVKEFTDGMTKGRFKKLKKYVSKNKE